ncbi:unnamed protein product [Arabidopsis lyrata]|nr:unnamed protein product [Arabidopsis lyrata]
MAKWGNEDLVKDEILQHLPVKSLIRFKSVSKQWRSMIESTYFVRKHLVCPFSNPKIVVGSRTHDDDNSLTILLETFSRDHQGEIDTQISRSPCSYIFHGPRTVGPTITICKVIGSCDGLVCIQELRNRKNLEPSVYIINPTTREHRKLYPTQLQHVPDFMPLLLFCIGFGKDIVTGTYKTININCYKRLDEHAMLLKTSVLNLDNGSEQRHIGVFPVSNMEISNEQTSVFANGSVFWLTQRYHKSSSKTPIKLVALDLHTETFSRVSWPSWYDEQHSHKMRLCSLKDRLCLSNVLQYPDVDVWSLKMEDSIEKWE